MKILIVDDHQPTLALLSAIVKKGDYEPLTTERAKEALKLLNEKQIGVVFTDLVMPQMGGLEFLKRAKAVEPDLPIIVMTGQGTIESAVEAMRHGAEDYLTKPIARSEVLLQIERALEKRRLVTENRELRGELAERYSYDKLIGNSRQMKEVYSIIAKVAPSDVTVMISGENGTGKDLVARALHYNSRRSAGPFVKIDCTALPEGLLESELFGYKRGAFTGADRDKPGRVENAENGTLFLDEISDLTMPLQAKVLRLIQEHRFERLGENKTRSVDVRILAATNRDLEKEIERGAFRRDLFYRLNVVPIELPPLREREGDVLLLATRLLERTCERYERRSGGFEPEAVDALMRYRWPGNVRELENLIERLVVLADGQTVRVGLDDLPDDVVAAEDSFLSQAAARDLSLEELEKEYIKVVLTKTGGHKAKAAELLGINRKTLLEKRKRYGLD
ncbi:MAG: response regulator [Candidatus Coatesbacteria bacterium]|nr:response regulator [Candidatus Coatesbacteria bacterium]